MTEEIPENPDSVAFETPAQTPIRENPDDDTSLVNLDGSYLVDQVIPSLPSDSKTSIVNDVTKTPPGLTLEELEQAEPQVKALYLAHPTRNDSQGQSLGKGKLCLHN